MTPPTIQRSHPLCRTVTVLQLPSALPVCFQRSGYISRRGRGTFPEAYLFSLGPSAGRATSHNPAARRGRRYADNCSSSRSDSAYEPVRRVIQMRLPFGFFRQRDLLDRRIPIFLKNRNSRVRRLAASLCRSSPPRSVAGRRPVDERKAAAGGLVDKSVTSPGTRSIHP